MPRRHQTTPRFRRRLTLTFIVVVGIAGGLLSLTSYFLFERQRYQSSEESAARKVRLAKLQLGDDLDLRTMGTLLADYRERGGFETIIVQGDVVTNSSDGLGLDEIPAGVRDDLPDDDVRSIRADIDGEPYLVMSGLAQDGSSELYFLFSELEIAESLRQFRNVLAVSWLVTVTGATVLGEAMARRTLRPVRDAAFRSRTIAEELLEQPLVPNSNDEFAIWSQSFDGLAEALVEKIGALSEAAARERRFTSDVAHELRTPLTALVSSALVIDQQLDEFPAGARRSAEIVLKEVRYLNVLVLELLELARIDAGSDPVCCEALSLRSAVDAVLMPYRDRGIEIRQDIDPELHVYADRRRFRRVVANLVTNALEHGESPVEIVAVGVDGNVAITVSDSGAGFPPDSLPRIFDRFFKADNARSGGSGLGLSIAFEHARAQGGTVTAENLPHGGARLTFSLRRAPASERQAESW